MNTSVRVALLVMAAALLAGAVWSGTQNIIGWAITYLALAFLCVVFTLIAWVVGR